MHGQHRRFSLKGNTYVIIMAHIHTIKGKYIFRSIGNIYIYIYIFVIIIIIIFLHEKKAALATFYFLFFYFIAAFFRICIWIY